MFKVAHYVDVMPSSHAHVDDVSPHQSHIPHPLLSTSFIFRSFSIGCIRKAFPSWLGLPQPLCACRDLG